LSIARLNINFVSPSGSLSVVLRDTHSPKNLVVWTKSPSVTILTNIKLANWCWYIHTSWNFFCNFSKLIFTRWWRLSDHLKPNIVSVVNAPKNWSVTDGNPHELSSDLFPTSTGGSVFGASCSFVDMMVKVDGVGLANTS